MATNDELMQQMRELAEILKANTEKTERLSRETAYLYERMHQITRDDDTWFDALVRRVVERITRMSTWD